MRKFNLKGTVIERMKGIQREEPKSVEKETLHGTELKEMKAMFTEEQGVLSVAWRTDVGRLRKNNQDCFAKQRTANRTAVPCRRQLKPSIWNCGNVRKTMPP